MGHTGPWRSERVRIRWTDAIWIAVAVLALVAAFFQLNAWLVAIPIVAAAIAQVLSMRQQKWEWVWDHVLGPFYNFLCLVTDNPHERHWGRSPWDDVGPYDRMKVRSTLRAQIEEFSVVLEGFRRATTNFSNHLWDGHRDRLMKEFLRVLGNFVETKYLRWKTFGKEGGGSWEAEPFFDVVYLGVVRNPTDEEAAWRAVENLGPGMWDVVIETIRNQSPETLGRIHLLFVADPAFERSQSLLKVADSWREAVLQRARLLRRGLERRV